MSVSTPREVFRIAGATLAGAVGAGVVGYVASGGHITPAQVREWAEVLRLDPLVIVVGWWVRNYVVEQHNDAMALLRSIRDELIVRNQGTVMPDERPIRRRGEITADK